MAIVACKECKKDVSDKAASCPHCGVASPGRAVGKLKVYRVPAAAGKLAAIEVWVDGKSYGKLDERQTKEIELPPGDHALRLTGDYEGESRLRVAIRADETCSFRVWFNVWWFFKFVTGQGLIAFERG